METAFDLTQKPSEVPTIPEDPGGRHEAPVARGKNPQGTIGACDACRMRKVRCLANEDSRSSKCQRCARAGRECVYTTHSKTRRRKRTDTRVKELEQRVAEMSFLLEHGRSSSTPSSIEKDDDGVDHQGTNSDIGGVFSFSSTGLSPGVSSKDTSSVNHGKKQAVTQSFPSSKHAWEHITKASDDVIDRGILSVAKANELYQKYLDVLMPQYPAVPLSCTMAELRSNKPTLLLAVLAASSGTSDPSLNRKLNHEIQSAYATKVSIQGIKSLELVQALLVSILWTYPPDKFEDLKFHQQIHMAATMALDLGLASKPKGNSRGQQSFKMHLAAFAENQGPANPGGQSTRFPVGQPMDVTYEAGTADHVMSPKKFLPDSSAVESRRTLLACYLFCASVSMSLRLPNFLRYSSWMADCSVFLKTSPDAAPSDKRFVAWVQLQRIVEQCGTNFALDSQDDTVSLADERAQLMLQSYEKQMEAWRAHAVNDDNIMNPFLEITYHGNNVYLHEIALHPDHDAEDFKPPFSVAVDDSAPHPPIGTLTPPYINAIIQCLASSNALIETFLNMSINDIRATPTLVYVRVVYAVVILIKLFISTSSTELSNVLKHEDIKVSIYLEKLLVHLKAVAALDDGNTHLLGAKFVQILTKVRMWFHQQQSKPEKQPPSANNDDPRPLVAGFEPARPMTTETKCEDPPQQYADNDKFSFITTDFNKPPTMNPPAAASWPNNNDNQYQHHHQHHQQHPTTTNNHNNGYADPNYPVQPTWNDLAFDFPMDLDPNLFAHLIQADQTHQNCYQDGNDTSSGNVDAYNHMDYLNNMPNFGGWPMQ